MNDQSWQLVEHAFNIAIELPAAQREAYLETACLDAEIRREVESLIEAEERSKTYFESKIAAAARDAVAERDKGKEKKKEERVGGYLLLRAIGTDVHFAEDKSGARVVLRVLPGPDTNLAIDRVAAERRALEQIRHPYLARTLDGGETPKRAPFVVTELVEGESLEEYCDARELSIEARIDLFQKICHAVHHGHQNLRLHGSLEAKNILITPDGAPKLINFGLARLQAYAEDREVRRRSADFSSPEEIRGERATTASEIYSLGVILYRLLVGRPPYDLRSSAMVEIERIVSELRVPRPSAFARLEPDAEALARRRGLTPKLLESRLRGDLDRIALRAMQKAPEDRYESAVHLSEDLTAFLEKRPVRARALGWPYKVGKLVQRRWKASVAAALLLVALVGFAAWSGIRAFQTSRELAAANQARSEAEAVASFLTEIYGVADPRENRGSSVTAREVLDWGADRVEREMSDRPERQAVLLTALSEAYARLGLLQRAHELAESALAKRKQALGGENPAVAPSLNHLGRVERLLGRFAEAEDRYREALELDRRAGDDAAIASDLEGLAATLCEAGALEDAEGLARAALALREATAEAGRPALAGSQRNLGWILFQEGRYEEAETSLRAALESQRAEDGDLHPETARTLGMLGAVLRDAESYEQAEDSLGKALSATLEIHGERHPEAADNLRLLAQVLGKRGRVNEAREMLQVALDVDQSALGPDHLEVAADLAALGELARASGDFETAEANFRRALEIRVARLDPDHRLKAESLLALGSLLAESDIASDGQLMLQEALRIFHKALPDGHASIAEAETALASSLARQQRYRDAERVLVNGPAADGVAPERRRVALATLEKVYRAWGREDEADRTAEALLALQ